MAMRTSKGRNRLLFGRTAIETGSVLVAIIDLQSALYSGDE